MRALPVIVLALGCARNPPAETPFTTNKVEGAFALLDLTHEHLETIGDVDAGYLPCGTFQIPSALVALNTGADEEHIGLERMKTHLREFEYGNQSIDELRITPRQQTLFLEKLRRRKLPVPYRYMKLVERDLSREESNGFVMHAKSGGGVQDDRAIGWLVGFVDRDKRSWAFATFVRGQKDEESRIARVRIPLAKALLARYGAWPLP
jgi:beta-lactamase class D